MSDRPGLDTLDGGWWPQSRDLAVELADLVDHFPAALGRVQHAVYSPPDWSSTPRRVRVRDGYVELDAVPEDDTHVVLLRTSQRLTLRLLVVPHDFSDDQGAEALLAAADDRLRVLRGRSWRPSPTSSTSTPTVTGTDRCG